MAAWNPAPARTWRFCQVQAARSRGWEPPWPARLARVPRVPDGSKSRKVAILATLLVPGRNGSEGRLGPPDFVEKPETAGKAGKDRGTAFLRVQGALAEVYPGRENPPWTHPQSPASWLHYAGLPGLLEPRKRNRPLYAASVVRAFPGPSPGHPSKLGYPVCMHGESRSKLLDAVGFVGGALEGPTSLRSLEGTRVGPAGIEARRALSDVCAFCVRVPGCKAAGNRGPCKHGPSTYAWEQAGLPRPACAVWIGLAWLPTEPASGLCSFASCDLGQSSDPEGSSSGNRFAPLLSLDGRGGRSGASWRLLPSASRGKRCFPRTPIQSSRALQARSSTRGSRWLNVRVVVVIVSSRILGPEQARDRDRELPLPPPSSLATSRRAEG